MVMINKVHLVIILDKEYQHPTKYNVDRFYTVPCRGAYSSLGTRSRSLVRIYYFIYYYSLIILFVYRYTYDIF